MPYGGRKSTKAHSKSAGRRSRAASRRRNSKSRRQSAQARFRLSRPRASTVRALSSILETKKYRGMVANSAGTGFVNTGVSTGTLAQIGTVIVPKCFIQMYNSDTVGDVTPDLAGACMDGHSLFCKYLKLKVQIDYPDGAFSPTTTPRPVELIWGFVNPLNLTPYTTPTDKDITVAQITQHVIDVVANEFNQENDPLQFHDRQKRLYNIIGRKKMIPNMHKQAPSAPSFLASASKMLETLSWPMNKKVRYTASSLGLSPGTLGDKFMYPNEAYIPFALLYNPDQAMYVPADGAADPSAYKINYQFNDCMWYNDA